jgi:uncharacterized membrane protein YtjA (UPF0391 family)
VSLFQRLARSQYSGLAPCAADNRPAERQSRRGVAVALQLETRTMLKWAIIFAVIALIAGALGFTGVAGAAAMIAKVLFFIFLVVCLLFVVLGVTVAKKI